MTKKVRRTFRPEFKAEAVQLVLKSGRPVRQVAKDLGLQQTVLNDWVRQARGEGAPTKPARQLTTEEQLRRLEEEVRTLRMERDFLKKAAAFFAKQMP